MANYLKPQLYTVEFSAIDPNGEHATADCISEAMTKTQAENNVVVAARASGFRHIHHVRSHLTTDDELKRIADKALNSSPLNTMIH